MTMTETYPKRPGAVLDERTSPDSLKGQAALHHFVRLARYAREYATFERWVESLAEVNR